MATPVLPKTTAPKVAPTSSVTLKPITPLKNVSPVKKPGGTVSDAKYRKLVDASSPTPQQIADANKRGVNPVTGAPINGTPAKAPQTSPQVGTSASSQGRIFNLPTKPTPTVDSSQNKGRIPAEDNFTVQYNAAAKKEPGLTIDEFRKRMQTPGEPGQGNPATPPTPGAQPDLPQGQADSMANASEMNQMDTDDWLKEADMLAKAGTMAEQDYREAMMLAAQERYDNEQAKLNSLQEIQKQVLESRNRALSLGSDVQRRDAELAYETAKSEYNRQRERSDEAYKQQLIEQELSNKKALLDKESAIAAMGGFGSLNKFKERQETILQNDRVMNSIKFERDFSNHEITDKINELTKSYSNDLFKIETNKQVAIQENYDKFLEYVTQISADKEKSEDEKMDAIREAQANYKKNVSAINTASFNTKYEISQKAAQQAKEMKLGMIDPQVSQMLGYAADARGNPIKDEKGQKIEVPKDLTKDAQYVPPVVDPYGRVVREGGYFDFRTKSFVPISQGAGYGSGGTAYNPSAAAVPTSGPANPFKEIGNKSSKNFDQCGHFTNQASTGAKVGDTWQSKLDKVDKWDNPKAGDSLAVPLPGRDGKVTYGHMALVLGYNPGTGDIKVVERNKDLRGSTNFGTYNLFKLQQQYGNNFGFISGELTPQAQQAFAQYGGGQSQPMGSGQDIVSEAMSKGYTSPEEVQQYRAMKESGKNPPDLTQTISDPKERATLELRFSKEYLDNTKGAQLAMTNGRMVEQAFRSAMEASKSGKSMNASTQAMVNGFSKILDPTSVVREAEYNRTPEGQAFKEQMFGLIQRLEQGGAGLTVEGLRDIYDQSMQLVQQYQMAMLDYATLAERQATSIGLNLENILPPSALKAMEEARKPKKAPPKLPSVPETNQAPSQPNQPKGDPYAALRKKVPNGYSLVRNKKTGEIMPKKNGSFSKSDFETL